MNYTVVGVVGHIDHGKTSLVAALTGVDTDTHPEEKRRGITIDLGFASFTAGDRVFALIDAPGHQRYVGNLLAGVARVDIGLLVVACDQGIQEQTLEHASILQALGVKRLVVAMSRADLVDQSAIDTLHEELTVFLEDYGFTSIPMVAVSTVRRSGIEQLVSNLQKLATEMPESSSGGYFRMPIDRVFTMPGRGCVLAGTIWSGQVQMGDQLKLLHSDRVVRVREVEMHGEAVDASVAGRRTALNVTGVSATEICRGDELLQSDTFTATHHVLVKLSVFRTAQELKCPATAQLHLAATSCNARITGIRRLSPGFNGVVVVETDEPVVATYGQRCLFRLPYPVGTFASGTVLAGFDWENCRARRLVELGEKLVVAEVWERLAAWVDHFGEMEIDATWLELQAGIVEADLESSLKTAAELGRIIRLPGSPRLVSAEHANRVRKQIVGFLGTQAEAENDAWVVEESLLRQLECFGSAECIHWLVDCLVAERQLARLGSRIAIASGNNTLSKKQYSRMEAIVAVFQDNRSPPFLKDIAADLKLPLESVTSLARFAVEAGMLVDAGNGLLIATSVFRQLCAELTELFSIGNERTVAEIRDCWQLTRKHAVPLLEYCDRLQLTVRQGNARSAGPKLHQFLST